MQYMHVYLYIYNTSRVWVATAAAGAEPEPEADEGLAAFLPLGEAGAGDAAARLFLDGV